MGTTETASTTTETSGSAPGLTSPNWPMYCGLPQPCAAIGAVKGDPESVDLWLKGPADKWFGIGPNSDSMTGSFAITVLGNGDVIERELGAFTEGEVLSPSHFQVLSNSVESGHRIVHVRGLRAGPVEQLR